MVKAIVAGAAGRMGKKVIGMICQSEGITLAGAFEHPENPFVNRMSWTKGKWSSISPCLRPPCKT
jgi:dihydrodipicolinate reductase